MKTEDYIRLDDKDWTYFQDAARRLSQNHKITNSQLGQESHPLYDRLVRAFALRLRFEVEPQAYRDAWKAPTNVLTDAQAIDNQWLVYKGGGIDSTLYWLGLVIRARHELSLRKPQPAVGSHTAAYLTMSQTAWKAAIENARQLVGGGLDDVELAALKHPHEGRLVRALALYYRKFNRGGPSAPALSQYRRAMADPVQTDPDKIDRAWSEFDGGAIDSTLYWLGLVTKARREVQRQLDKQEKFREMYTRGYGPFREMYAGGTSTGRILGVDLNAIEARVLASMNPPATLVGKPQPQNYLKNTPSFEELVRLLDGAETVTEAVDALVDNFTITRKEPKK